MKLELNPHSWVIGVYAVPDECGLDLGPLGLQWEPVRPPPSWLDRSWCLGRIVLGKLEVSLNVDLSIWWIGYCSYGWDDQGLYCGPINMQIEYGKSWRTA